jgi:hypothetical protein
MKIHIRGPRKNSAKNLNIYYFSNMFSPYREENGIGDRSAEENLKNSKSPATLIKALHGGLSTHIKNSSIYQVTQSL